MKGGGGGEAVSKRLRRVREVKHYKHRKEMLVHVKPLGLANWPYGG